MNGRHAKNALAGTLEMGDLDDHRQALDDKDSADQQEEELLFDQHRHRADRPAEGQGAGIAHEDLGRIGVIPEKAQGGAEESGAKNRQLARLRQIDNIEIVAEINTAGEISDQAESDSPDRTQSDQQAVKSVGQVRAVRHGRNHKGDHKNVKDAKFQLEILQERNGGAGTFSFNCGQIIDDQPDKEPDDHLADQLVAPDQPLGHLFDDFEIVIEQTQHAQPQSHDHHHPDPGLGDLGEQKGRDQGAHQNEETAHARGAALAEMGLRPVRADLLADLLFAQSPDQGGPDEQAQRQRQQRSDGRPEADVAEKVEDDKIVFQWREQIVEHGFNPLFRIRRQMVLNPLHQGLHLHSA